MLFLLAQGHGGGATSDTPLTPDQARTAFELEPGLRVDIVAAEPLTTSPCALAWDERGRLYVAENRGYPTGGPGGEPAGGIALLEDTDGDGRLDKRTEFVRGLTFPNGVMPWRGGLIVTCAPEVFYFQDTDDDGRADVKRVLLTGFATNQSTQLRVNKPMLAPDGWVYLASGLSGGRITSPQRPADPPLELKGDLRFNPDTGAYEQTDGKSQFGQSFDDFGRRFGVFNRVQVQHFVLPSRYLERNSHLTSPGVLQNCPELVDNPFLRGGGGAARLYPISANITTADSHTGTFTAACAIHIYRGGALPAEYDGHAFSCDPTGNLVHQDRLEPSGATFAARRVAENVEFLRSRDDWFRPVFLATGPDGALYVCDMSRKVIEHPEYLPAEVRKHTDFESGKTMGRIWRVASAENRTNPQPPSLASASTRTLVRELDSPNSWRRDTAFRLLVERQDRATASLLKRDLFRLKSPAALAARLHLLALCQGLDEATLQGAFDAKHEGVREVALKLAEPRLAASPQLQARTLPLADDPGPRVRFQCALAIGSFLGQPSAPAESMPALARLAVRDAADKWTRAAVLSSVGGRERDFLRALRRQPTAGSDGLSALFAELGRVLSRAVPAAQSTSLLPDLAGGPESDFDLSAAGIQGFAEGRPGWLPSLDTSGEAWARRLGELFQEARRHVADASTPPSRRVHAADLLGLTDDPSANPLLLERLRSGEPFAVQVAAVRALTRPHNAGGARDLLARERWAAFAPALRGTVLGALLGRPEHHAALLDALESGDVPLSALDSVRREQLKRSKNDSIRLRAEKVFASSASGDRWRAFEESKACLTLKPVPGNGREIFRRLCAGCHRLDREGIAVGPDLFDVRGQPKETILLHIVVPEQEIAPNFTCYLCETKDGRALTGLIAAETSTSVTFRQAQGLEETISRNEMTELKASPLSLMPQELEKGMTPQELADLLGYLKGEAE